MVAATERKSAYEKALLIASGPAMLERLVRPIKEAGLAVKACESFEDAENLFTDQALVVLPIKEDEQADAKSFIESLRQQAKAAPYMLGVGRCEEGQRQGLVAKMGLNDLIAYPFDEEEVNKRLASFRRWCEMPLPGDVESASVTLEEPDQAMLQTSRVSLFAGAPEGEEPESAESIYCREAPVGIAMFDRQLNYLLANPRWIQQFRLRDREIIGRNQFDVFPKLHPNWKRIYQRCLNGETRRGRETIGSGNGPIEMRWEVRPWRYRTGQIGGVTIAFEEAWKQGEESAPAVVETKAAPELFPAQFPGPALLLDLQGNVLESNQSAENLGLAKPDDAFLEKLREGLDALPLTELVESETSSDELLAWSNSVLRDASGEPDRILRVGVSVPRDLLPVVEKVTAVEVAPPMISPTELLGGRSAPHRPAPQVPSFEDDALDELPQLIWKANARGEITYFNKAWLEFRGRPLKRELNGGWLDGLHSSDARSTKGIVAEAIRNQKSLDHTFRLKSDQGEYVSMDMWVEPYHSPDNELLGFYGVCEEHREAPASANFASSLLGGGQPMGGGQPLDEGILDEARRDANDALAKLAAAEREVLDLKEALGKLSRASGESQTSLPAGPTMLWQADAAGKLTHVNAKWNELLGRDLDAPADDSVLAGIKDPQERQTVQDRLAQAAEQGVPATCEFTWRRPNGETTLMELCGEPQLDSEGRTGLSGFVRDVEQEAVALKALQTLVAPEGLGDEDASVAERFGRLASKLPGWQERQVADRQDLLVFREIFDHAAVGIVLLGSDGRALFTNRRHRELLDFSIDDLGGIEDWLRRGCGDEEHTASVLKFWREDIWQRQLTKTLALKSASGTLREIRFEPQLFVDDNRLLLTLHDVTESKRSEEAMRESEIRFRALFRESSMGIALVDAEEKIYDVNPGLERVLEVPKRQILCRPFDECLHSEDLPRKQAVLQQLLASPKRNAEIELRLAKRRDQSGVTEDSWIRLNIALVRDVDQRVLFTAYFVQDITEQKRVQAELQISQEQNRALLEIIPDLILLVDRRAQVIDLMPGEQMPDGLVEENAIGNRVDAVLPSLGHQFDQLIQKAYVVDDVVHFPFTTPQGRTFAARIVACKPDNAVVTIHEERPVEAPAPPAPEPTPAEIPEEVERMALTFSSSPEAVVITDYSGGILEWNAAAASLFGYSREEASGQPLPALFGVDSVESLTRHLRQDEAHRWTGQIPFLRKDRSEGLADIVFAPLKSASGSLQGEVAFIRETEPAPAPPPPPPAISVDREALAAEIREESLAKLVPQMHQRLRNNLQIISTLLNLQYKSQPDDQTRNALRTSKNRAHALLLLHELIQAKEDEEEVDFGQFARALCDHLIDSYEVRDRITVEFECDGFLDLQAASPLSLILNELVTNAIVHGFPEPESGVIKVSLRLSEGAGELRVQDDGFGMKPVAPESQGMGLQIARTLANQIGGSLETIDSTETEFLVCFMTSLRK